jgi:hypothetical protein
LGGVAAAAAAAVPPLFETLRWTARGTEMAALSSQPASCLTFDPNIGPMVQAGEALFNTPNLLGGQAAKAGLSCASCHVNGRSNPHFQLTGVSDKPGTADVTNNFFSAARDNRRFDPVPIADLALSTKVSRDPVAQSLEPFIRNQIVDEFAGEEPSQATLHALASYVRAIRVCPNHANTPVPWRLHDQLVGVKGALDASSASAEKGDLKQAKLLVAAARHQLGLVNERYAGSKLTRERALLVEVSRELQNITASDGSADSFRIAIIGWQSRFDKQHTPQLARTERLSLYNSKRLRSLVAPQRKNR